MPYKIYLFIPEGLSILSWYIISILLFLNSNSLFLFWILLEINAIIFIGIIFLDNFGSKDKLLVRRQSLYYFLIQSFRSLTIIVCCFFFRFNGSSIINYVVVLSLLAKSGLFPFHFWIYKIRAFIPSFSFIVLLIIQKLPFVMFFSNYFNIRVLLSILANLLLGSVIITFSKSFTSVMISSSIYRFFWIISFLLFGFMFFLFFLFIYLAHSSLFILNFCRGDSPSNLKSFISSIVCGLFFLGLPPFRFFFFKFYLIEFFFQILPLNITILIWACIILRTFGYFKFFSPTFFRILPFYSSSFSIYLPLHLFLTIFFINVI